MFVWEKAVREEGTRGRQKRSGAGLFIYEVIPPLMAERGEPGRPIVCH